MKPKTRWRLILLVALAGHFMDGWSYPPHATALGWWLWHAVNWLRRDLVLVILLWPMIMRQLTIYEVLGKYGWSEYLTPRFDLPERLALWTLAAGGNYLLHQVLYWLGTITRSVLE